MKLYHSHLILCSDKGSPLGRVMLFPWGAVQWSNGDPFLIDELSAASILQEFQRGNKDLPIDYEHVSVTHETPDGRAPAAGWITDIESIPTEGIFATVKWNAEAKEMIQADQYRYLSPVFYLSEDRRVVAVVSAALTNTPAILDMQRVAAKNNGEKNMDLKALKQALASAGVTLADNVDDAGVISAVVDLLIKKVEPNPDIALASSLRKKLCVASNAGEDVVLAAVDALRQGVVSSTEYTALKTKLEHLEMASKSREAKDLIDSAVKAAKLNPKDEKFMKYATNLASTDPEAFKTWLEAAPVLYTPGRVVNPDKNLDEHKTDRKVLIASAREEWKSNTAVQGLTDEKDFVNDALRAKSLAVLAKDELN